MTNSKGEPRLSFIRIKHLLLLRFDKEGEFFVFSRISSFSLLREGEPLAVEEIVLAQLLPSPSGFAGPTAKVRGLRFRSP